jgi:hypothetical protein
MTMEGMEMDEITIPVEDLQPAEPTDPVLVHIRTEREHYTKALAKIEAGRLSWNWAPFFVGIYWLLYRKMVGATAVLYALVTILLMAIPRTTSEMLMEDPNRYLLLTLLRLSVSVVLLIALGLFGDAYYLRRLHRKFSRLASDGTDTSGASLAKVIAKKDVSWGYFWGYGILFFVANVVFVFFVALLTDFL